MTDPLSQLLRDIEQQDQWADELARMPMRKDNEPLDSLRYLIQKDDKTND